MKKKIKNSIKTIKKLNLFITEVDVFVKPIGICRGFFKYENRYPTIYISSINPYRIGGAIKNFIKPIYNMSDRETVKDTFFHEYGHAYSSYAMQTSYWFCKKYQKLFGSFYDEEESEFDADIHITRYAAKSPDEDFAECFMVFIKNRNYIMKYKGKKFSNGVHHKMKFIESLTRI